MALQKKKKKNAFLYAACFAKEQQNSKARRKIVAKGTEALHHSNTRHLKPFFFSLYAEFALQKPIRFLIAFSLRQEYDWCSIKLIYLYKKCALEFFNAMPCYVTSQSNKNKPWCWNCEEVVWNFANSLLARFVPSANREAATWLWNTTLAPAALPVTANTCIGTWGINPEKPLKRKKKRVVTDSAGQGGLGEQWRCVTNCCIRRLTDCARLSSRRGFLIVFTHPLLFSRLGGSEL